MKPLTEGSMLHAKKKRNNVKKETKHNKGTHTQISLCNIMMGSLLVGSAIILIAAVFNFLGTTYIVSIAISLGVIYLLPNFINRTTPHVTKMKYDAFIVWFIIFFGPVMTIFILAIFLLPPTFMSESIAKKKTEVKESDETK